ncbi:MAG: FMN-binding negative transcriptional regulator [bacterium]
MYIPRSYAEQDSTVLHAFIEAHPFAALITATGGLFATHLPLVLRPGDGDHGVLEGHIARANPHHERGDGPLEALVIFSGAHAHVTPTWYPSKLENSRVVPTWNYVAVHAYGTIRFRDDDEFLRVHLARLSNRHEQARGSDWTPDDPPAKYVAQQLRAIVGLEITINRLEGKWKMSQNRSEADREGVADGLRQSGTPADADVAQIVSDRLGR